MDLGQIGTMRGLWEPAIICAVGEPTNPEDLWEFGVMPKDTESETVDLVILWIKAHRELIDVFIAGGDEPMAYVDGYRIFFVRWAELHSKKHP